MEPNEREQGDEAKRQEPKGWSPMKEAKRKGTKEKEQKDGVRRQEPRGWT